MDIYQAELQSRTQNSTKHVCLLMFSCCVIGCKHLLIQLWINRVTAEGLYQVLCRDSAVAFQLETSQSLAPLFSRGLHRGAAICHTAHSHTSCTQCIHCMNKKTHTKKRKIWEQACSGTNIHTTEKHTRTPTYCTCTFSSLWAHSFLLQRHKSYHACCQGRGRETERVMAWVWLWCNYCIFFSILVRRVCACVRVRAVYHSLCVYRLYYSRYPIQLQFGESLCHTEDLWAVSLASPKDRQRDTTLTHRNTFIQMWEQTSEGIHKHTYLCTPCWTTHW